MKKICKKKWCINFDFHYGLVLLLFLATSLIYTSYRISLILINIYYPEQIKYIRYKVYIFFYNTNLDFIPQNSHLFAFIIILLLTFFFIKLKIKK